MKLVIQRVSRAKVEIDGKIVSEIGRGLLVLVGIVPSDTQADVDWLANKCVKMRIFPDENGVMNRSVADTGGDILAVSQLTLAADISRGNRPSYIGAAGHDLAVPLYDSFCDVCSRLLGRPVGRGVFGADMQVSLLNDGPVTIIADSKNR